MTQKAIEALRAVEWAVAEADHVGDTQWYCPYCGEQREDGHTDSCLVGQALKEHQQESV